jgi:RNA polymerase sigma factor (sigma-70 family)
MAGSLLHLVDQENAPVKPEIRIAVEAAYRWSIREYPNIDDVDLAAMAEGVGLRMSKRFHEIQSPRRYAFAALSGRIQEWFRGHPAKMVSFESEDEFDREIGPDNRLSLEAERRVLFAQIRRRLSERDRQICMLLEQDVTSPREIAKALEISYSAAAKALERARERMASIVRGKSPEAEKSSPRKILSVKPVIAWIANGKGFDKKVLLGGESERGSTRLSRRSYAQADSRESSSPASSGTASS